MKKTIAVLSALIFALSAMHINVFAAPLFSDLTDDHWAYSYIMQLVDEKTINGYEDGTFRPENIVNKDEFSKMITGEWQETGKKITREGAIIMLWELVGKSAKAVAPGIITRQSNVSKDAVAWGYSTGLMTGDDGIHIRPEQNLTRAEAAALIVRSKSAKISDAPMADLLPAKLLETIWNGYNIFDSEYVPDETVTNGELARAALRLGLNEYNLLYRGLNSSASFEHKYATDVSIINRECVGEENKVTAEFADAAATQSYAAAVLMYNAVRQFQANIGVSDVSISGDLYGAMTNMCIAFGFENGLRLYPDKYIEPEEIITKKNIAVMLLEIDDITGRKGIKICKDLGAYPNNSDKYLFITEGIPSGIYEYPIEGNPKEYYNFANEYSLTFKTMLTDLEKLNDGVKFTYYPSMVCETNESTTIRVKCEVDNAETTELFGRPVAELGNVFYADIKLPYPVVDIHLNAEDATVTPLL